MAWVVRSSLLNERGDIRRGRGQGKDRGRRIDRCWQGLGEDEDAGGCVKRYMERLRHSWHPWSARASYVNKNANLSCRRETNFPEIALFTHEISKNEKKKKKRPLPLLA